MCRTAALCSRVSLISALATTALAQTTIHIDGQASGTSGWISADEGQTLVGTTQGRITITTDPGGWGILAVNVTLADVDPESAEYDTYQSLVAAHPWLASTPSTVAASLGSAGHPATLVDRVNPTDLATLANQPLLVRPIDVHAFVAACVDPADPDPDLVRKWGQAMLAGEAQRKWVTSYPVWGDASSTEFWLPTYARPASGPDEWQDINWFRLLESAVRAIAGLNGLLAFTRSGDAATAAELGLRIQIQAIVIRGNNPPPPTDDPATTPGIVNIDPQNLPRFTITQPILIAIPFTAPFLPTSPIPYDPGVVNLTTAQPGDTMLAAIGCTTSATHAFFFDGKSSSLKSQLLRLYPGGPIAMFRVPTSAVSGTVRFVDMLGEDEGAALPIADFTYTLPPPASITPDTDKPTNQ